MTAAPRRRWSSRLRTILVIVGVLIWSAIMIEIGRGLQILLSIRESARKADVRMDARTGRLDPEAGHGVLEDVEIEAMKAHDGQ